MTWSFDVATGVFFWWSVCLACWAIIFAVTWAVDRRNYR